MTDLEGRDDKYLPNSYAMVATSGSMGTQEPDDEEISESTSASSGKCKSWRSGSGKRLTGGEEPVLIE